MEHILEIKRVSKKYNEEIVLENINLVINKGDIVGIIGKNGSGKSTLLKCICGLVYYDSGEIIIENKIYKKGFWGEVYGDMGILIESPKFLQDFSGMENLMMLARIKNIIDKNEIVSLMELMNLKPYDKKKVSKYSLGMKQKLGIIQAIMEKPKLVLFDEPTNALDESSTKIVQDKIKQMSQNGTSFIIVSHLKEDLECICDRIYRIKDHKLIENTVGDK